MTALIPLSTGAPTLGINTLANADFANGTTGWTTWSRAVDSTDFQIDSQNGHSGSSCLRVLGIGGQDWYVSPSAPARTPVLPGQVWEFGAWIRNDGAYGPPALSFVTRDSNGTVLDWGASSGNFPTSDTGWIRGAVCISVPTGCAFLQPRVVGWGKAAFRLDDLDLHLTEYAPVDVAALELANDSLRVRIDPLTLGLRLRDSIGGDTVVTGSVPKLHYDSVRTIGDSLRLYVHHVDHGWKAALDLWLKGGSLRISLKADSSSTLAEPLLFPGAVKTRAGQRLALPKGTGMAIPVEDAASNNQRTDFWAWQVSQAIVAGTDGRNGFVISVDQPWDASLTFFQTYGALLSPLLYQFPSKGVFGHERSIVIAPVRGDGWVGIAKRHRQRLDELGRVKTWKAKAAVDPSISSLQGALVWWVIGNGFPNIAPAFFDTLSSMGMERAVLNWHTASSSDIESLKKRGYIVSAYSCFTDAYPPGTPGAATEGYGTYSIQNEDGTYLPSFEQHLGDGSVLVGYLNCSLPIQGMAHRYFASDLQDKHRNGQFIDVTLSNGLHECWAAAHPTTRGRDAQARVDQIRLLKDTLHLVSGSEQTRDFAHGEVDWGEGPMSLAFTANAPWDWIQPVAPEAEMDRLSMNPAVRVPLLPLTDHDAFASTWYSGDGQSKVPARWDDKDAWNALYATMPLLAPVDHRMWDSLQVRYLRTVNLLGAINLRCGFAAMTGFLDLTDDHAVQRTEFDNHWTVTANFAPGNRVVGADTIPPKGFLAQGPGGERVERLVRNGAPRSLVRLQDRWYLDPERTEAEVDGVRSAGAVRMKQIDDSTIQVVFLGDQQAIGISPSRFHWRTSSLRTTPSLDAPAVAMSPDSGGWCSLIRPPDQKIVYLRLRPDANRILPPRSRTESMLSVRQLASGLEVRWVQETAGEAVIESICIQGRRRSVSFAGKSGVNRLTIAGGNGFQLVRLRLPTGSETVGTIGVGLP